MANNLVNRTPSARNAVYREVAAMQRKAWSASAGQIYWSYQLRGNRAFLPTIDPQSDTSRLDPWDLTHVWHAGWMAWGLQGMFGGAILPNTGSLVRLFVLSEAKLPALGKLAPLGTTAVSATATFTRWV